MSDDGLVHSLLRRAALDEPERTALVQGAERISYRQLQQRAEAIGQWLLAGGIRPGDRVGILTENAIDYVSSYFGVISAGAVAVGLNTQTSERTLATVLADSEAAAVLAQERFRSYRPVIEAQPSVAVLSFDIRALGGTTAHRAWPDLRPDDLCQIIYTSGTTGAPKGVMLSHRNLLANTRSNVSYLKLTRDDSVMAVLPFFYSYGNSVLLTHVAVGGTLVVNQSFLYPNLILDQMVAEQVTGFSGVPSSFAILLNRSAVRDYRFPALRYLTQAGAAMAPAVARELQQVFPEAEIYIMYGQTEAAPRLSYLEPHRILDKAGSIGKAIPGVVLEVCRPDGSPAAVGEVGEIVASGDNIMLGYWRQPQATAAVLRDGKLWTGDLARLDDEGFLFIEGRRSAMIKSGSHRIAPKEIEETIMELRPVHEAAVAGTPDQILGEKIVALVVLKPGAALSARDILKHCRRQLPAFKVPHQVIFRDELPKTSTGKIQTAELKTLIERALSAT